jgi:hypothetical protein
VKLPAARGAGQNWRAEPGNIISEPMKVRFNPATKDIVTIPLTKVIPPVEQPKDSEFIRHIKVRSEQLSKFWGTDVFLTAHVLVPKDFDKHPEARYPLIINHGHFPADFGGFSVTPPDPAMPCKPEPRFNEPCYNKIEAQEAHDLYKKWTSDSFPRMLIVEIDHSNPYYDDSYAVNSANLGPYGDSIMKELVPEIEKQFRGLGQGWARGRICVNAHQHATHLLGDEALDLPITQQAFPQCVLIGCQPLHGQHAQGRVLPKQGGRATRLSLTGNLHPACFVQIAFDRRTPVGGDT